MPYSNPRILRSVIALTLACALSTLGAAACAYAAVLDHDYVGGVQVSTHKALRAAAPDLSVPTGLLASMDGRELWSRDPTAHVAMASTTKIMTAVVVFEHAKLEDIVTVDKQAARVGESSMGLITGEQFTVAELLKGVLVQSGNDAAALVAEHVGGTIEGFVSMMNAKAAALDLPNTHYMNPHGLDAVGHYTSAADLVSLSRYAMRNSLFRDIVGTFTAKVRSDRYTHVLTSHNTLLKTYPGAEGVKTGNTNHAGFSMVFAAKRNGVELIGAVMGAASEGDRARQVKVLFDWGFKHYRSTQVTQAGGILGRIPISDYLERTAAAVTAETTSVPVFDLAGPVKRKIELLPSVPAPLKAGDRLGTLTLYQGSSILAQLPLVAEKDIPAPDIGQRIVFFFARIWRGIFGA
jgi:D-alanyl-D-alanine carboxypeptidase